MLKINLARKETLKEIAIFLRTLWMKLFRWKLEEAEKWMGAQLKDNWCLSGISPVPSEAIMAKSSRFWHAT